jgi:hypothetical protein
MPSFFEVDPSNPETSTYSVKPVKTEIGKNLPRGTQDQMLGDSEPVDVEGRDVRVLYFRDPRHIEDAFSILADHDDIGHPTFQRGSDGKSLIFYFWKADDKMKDKMEKAIKVLKDAGLLLDTVQYPNYAKR